MEAFMEAKQEDVEMLNKYATAEQATKYKQLCHYRLEMYQVAMESAIRMDRAGLVDLAQADQLKLTVIDRFLASAVDDHETFPDAEDIRTLVVYALHGLANGCKAGIKMANEIIQRDGGK